MSVTYSQMFLVVCMSLIIGACSSSDGAAPIQSGGMDGGMGAGLNDGISIDGDATATVDSDNGLSGSVEIAAESGGDTAGAMTEGVGTTGGMSDIVGAVAIPDIQGEWITRCLQQDSLFQQRTLSVVGARMLTELSVFSDQTCTIPVALSLDINGSTIQRNATTVPTGGTRTVSLGDAIEVNFYFEEGTIDNKPLTTSDFPDHHDLIKRIEYGIVLVQNEALYFGNSDLSGYVGDSAESRPISLNTLTVFNRML